MASLLSRKPNWGDEEDEGEYETKVDSKGQKIKVRTKTNSKGQTVRVTTTLKVVEAKVRVPKRVIARRNLPRFGEAVEGEVNVTLQSKDSIAMEHPDDSLVEDSEEAGLNSLASFILKQQERALEREHDLVVMDEDGNPVLPPEETEEPASSSGAGGKYVPPSVRQGAPRPSAHGDRDADSTLRVSNLSKAATEDDLRELFCRFGRVLRVSLPKVERKDERGNIYKEPKGFAYIAFAERPAAEAALNALHGHGYDHLILNIEWAKAPDNANREGSGFRSGYGEKLAQDTKEKVSFASNLTENK